MKLKPIDLTLIELLREDSRRTVSEMSTITGASRATVKDRIEKMHEGGVIRRFTIDADLARNENAFGIRAFFHLHLRRPVCSIVYQFVKDWPELAGCWSISGNLDMQILVEAATQDEIERLRDKLAKHPEIQTLVTSLILKTWVERISGVKEMTPEGYEIIRKS